MQRDALQQSRCPWVIQLRSERESRIWDVPDLPSAGRLLIQDLPGVPPPATDDPQSRDRSSDLVINLLSSILDGHFR